MILLIRANIDGAKTVFARLIILGLIPSRPVAFVEFNPFINPNTRSIDTYAIVKKLSFGFFYIKI